MRRRPVGGQCSARRPAQVQRYSSHAITPVLSRLESPVHRGKDVEFRLQIVSPRVATATVTRGQAMEAVHVAVFVEPQLLIEGLVVPIVEGPSPYSSWR